MNTDNLIFIDSFSNKELLRYHNLCANTWWAKDRTLSECVIIAENSKMFGILDPSINELISVGRAVTDTIRVATIFDIIVDENYRGKGIGKKTFNMIINHNSLKQVKIIFLQCLPEMQGFYEKLGFKVDHNPLVPMCLYK